MKPASQLSPRYPLRQRTLLAFQLTLLITSGAHAAAQAEPEIGTLLYSPVERNQIEHARQGDTASEQENMPGNLQLNGMVRRTHGKSTAWLNQRPHPEGKLELSRHAAVVGARGVQVDGQALRVGETLDLNNSQRSDILPPGALTSSTRKPRTEK